VSLGLTRSYAAESEIGVIVLPMGGSRLDQNRQQKQSKTPRLTYPTRIFFVPAIRHQQSTLQEDVRDLEDRGVHTIQ